MKNQFLSFILLAICFVSTKVFSQDDKDLMALGLPGDNLNLYAVLDIFQKSPTLEEFEKSINNKDSNINNLDLNNDNLVDYIKVIDYQDGSNHSIVLQAVVNDKENQDVAVIEVHKNKQGRILIQVIGDEDLYGKDYIIEPTAYKEVIGTPNPGYVAAENEVYYINDWPIVVHLFSPIYTIYFSPWYWGFYPSFWRPWAPIYYYNYWDFHHHYDTNHHFHRLSNRRFYDNYFYYTSRRKTSETVRANRRDGIFNGTYEGRTYRKIELPKTRTQKEAQIKRDKTSVKRNTVPLIRSQKSNVPDRRTAPPRGTRTNENTRRR